MTTKKEEGLHLILVDKFRKILKIWKNTLENSEKIPPQNSEKYSGKFEQILQNVQKNTPQKSSRQNHILLVPNWKHLCYWMKQPIFLNKVTYILNSKKEKVSNSLWPSPLLSWNFLGISGDTFTLAFYMVKCSLSIKENLQHKFLIRKWQNPPLPETFPRFHPFWGRQPFLTHHGGAHTL